MDILKCANPMFLKVSSWKFASQQISFDVLEWLSIAKSICGNWVPSVGND